MSSNKTEHLALHSWEPEDMFTREEFNENFAAIDLNAGKADKAITTAQAAANAAQSTADAAKTAASKAQTTADTANTAASKAQTTANTANTAASAAQTTANAANTAASKAQTTADGRLRFCCGKYTGSTTGSTTSVTKTLTFDFPARLVWLSTSYDRSDSGGPNEVKTGSTNNDYPAFLMFTREMTHVYVTPNNGGGYPRVIDLTWSGNTLKFTLNKTSTSQKDLTPTETLNCTGIVYHWFAIG